MHGGTLSTARTAAVAALLAVPFLCSCSSSASSSPHAGAGPNGTASAVPSAPPLDQARASQIGTALPGVNQEQINAVLAVSVRKAYEQHPSRLWPPGCTMKVNQRSFVESGPTAGTVRADANCSGTQSHWLLLLQWNGSSWGVLGTSQTKDGGSAGSVGTS